MDSHSLQVQIWTATVESLEKASPSFVRSVLSPEEVFRSERISHPRVRAEYLTARVLVRTFLSERYAEFEPWQWNFGRTYAGRPFILNPDLHEKVDFNVSHSQGMVVCAFATGCRVGVDVE